VEPEVLLAWVVVHQPDRRVAERGIAQHLAEDQLRRVTGTDDQHLLAPRDDGAGRRPLDQRPGEEANTHGEGEQQEDVDDPDPARDFGRVEVECREDEERGDGRDDDTAKHAPHVLRRHVPPPAVVEAEGDEDGQRHADDECDHVPLEVPVVVARPVAVEADVPGDDPRGGDQRRVDDDLPEPMPVHGGAHGYAGTPATERTASTTRSCCSRSMPPHIGRARFSCRGALRLGQRARGNAEVRERRLEMERRHVVRGTRDLRAPQGLGDLGPARRADDVQVVDVTRLVGRELDVLAETELRHTWLRLRVGRVPSGETRQEDAEHRGLYGVETGVRADELEGPLVAGAVEAEHPHTVRDVVVRARHEPAVAEREEVLRREEAEGRADPGLRDSVGAERLRGVLDEREPERDELVEWRRPAEEMDGHDRLRLPVIRVATSSASRFSVAGSMSAKTGSHRPGRSPRRSRRT
jgi:hypothetical protein